MNLSAVAASLSVVALTTCVEPVFAQQADAPVMRWRGPMRVIKENGSTTKSIKIGRQTVKVTVNLMHRSFTSDALAGTIFQQAGTLSGSITITPSKRGQTLPPLRVTSAVFARKISGQKDYWTPAIESADSAANAVLIPFITSGGIEVGGMTFAAPAGGKAFEVTNGPGEWLPASNVSGAVTLTDGRKSYRISLSKLPIVESTPVPPPPPPPVREADIEKELMIRDLSVVESAYATEPDGAWTFGRRFRLLFGSDVEAQSAVKKWLQTWEADQVVNDQTIAARAAIRSTIIEPWKARSGQAGVPDELWNVVWDDAPFRLLAIVNRTDLTDLDPRGGYGGDVSGAGEGRFVFGALDGADEPLPFTVIFEYRQPAGSFFEVSSWASRWHALGENAFGVEYNNDLKNITDELVVLNQLRTGEAALGDTWQFREFSLDAGELRPSDAKATPADHFNGTATLAKFINESEEIGVSVPLVYDGVPFRAGVSELPAGFVWNAPGAEPARRASMALLTCNGCHHAETGTGTVGSTGGVGGGFVHIAPRRAGAKSELSGFLRGDNAGGPLTVADPVTGETRSFNELAERKRILEALADSRPIFAVPFFSTDADTGAADLREGAVRAMQAPRRGRVH